MQAVRLHDKQDLRFEKIDPLQSVAEGEIRLKVAFAGICGSDIHNFKTGQWITRKPSTAGHEFAGVIHKVGKGVKGFEPGDKVVADSRDYCGTCRKCVAGKHHLCQNLGFVGESRDGGYAEFVDLPERLVFKCLPEAPLDVLALSEPLAVALHALKKIQVDAGPVCIIGCGPIGALSAMASKLMFDRDIYLCDVNAARAAVIASASGGSVASLCDLRDLAQRTSNPLSHILDTTGSVAVISDVVSQISDATLGLVGIGSGTMEFDPVHAVERELKVVGCHAFADEMPQAIELLQSYSAEFRPLIKHRIPLAQVPSEFSEIVAGNAKGIKTLIQISAG